MSDEAPEQIERTTKESMTMIAKRTMTTAALVLASTVGTLGAGVGSAHAADTSTIQVNHAPACNYDTTVKPDGTRNQPVASYQMSTSNPDYIGATFKVRYVYTDGTKTAFGVQSWTDTSFNNYTSFAGMVVVDPNKDISAIEVTDPDGVAKVLPLTGDYVYRNPGTSCTKPIAGAEIKRTVVEGANNDTFATPSGQALVPGGDWVYDTDQLAYRLIDNADGTFMVNVQPWTTNENGDKYPTTAPFWVQLSTTFADQGNGSGRFGRQYTAVFTDNALAPTTSKTEPVYTTVYDPVYGTKTTRTDRKVRLQVDYYDRVNRKGTYRNGALLKTDVAIDAGQATKRMALDDDNRLGFREDMVLWPTTALPVGASSSATHVKFIDVWASEIERAGGGLNGAAAVVRAKTGWTPTFNQTTTSPTSPIVKAWVMDTAHGATDAKPWGAANTLTQTDLDAALPTYLTTTSQVVTGYKARTVQTGTKVVQTPTQQVAPVYTESSWTPM